MNYIINQINFETSIDIYEGYEGESIEMKMERVLHSGEPIEDGAPTIYTPRKDGVRPEYNIRTDRFDVALDAMDTVSRSQLAKRMEIYKPSSNIEPEVATE